MEKTPKAPAALETPAPPAPETEAPAAAPSAEVAEAQKSLDAIYAKGAITTKDVHEITKLKAIIAAAAQ